MELELTLCIEELEELFTDSKARKFRYHRVCFLVKRRWIKFLDALKYWCDLFRSFNFLGAKFSNVGLDPLKLPQGLEAYIQEAIKVSVAVLDPKLSYKVGANQLSPCWKFKLRWIRLGTVGLRRSGSARGRTLGLLGQISGVIWRSLFVKAVWLMREQLFVRCEP